MPALATPSGVNSKRLQQGSAPRLYGGTFEQNGGTWGVANNGRGFRIDNGNVTTLNSGKIISGTLANTLIIGSTLIVNGGTFETPCGSFRPAGEKPIPHIEMQQAPEGGNTYHALLLIIPHPNFQQPP